MSVHQPDQHINELALCCDCMHRLLLCFLLLLLLAKGLLPARCFLRQTLTSSNLLLQHLLQQLLLRWYCIGCFNVKRVRYVQQGAAVRAADVQLCVTAVGLRVTVMWAQHTGSACEA
jgi:hypothetical protein